MMFQVLFDMHVAREDAPVNLSHFFVSLCDAVMDEQGSTRIKS